MYKRPARILFLCTGNACRSQMAEGFARAWGSQWLEARSAGLEAHGVNPLAVQSMADIGINISQQTSDILTPEMLEWADLVVTLCAQADALCPLLPASCRKKHWPVTDPARASGSETEISQCFAEVRDKIGARVKSMIGGLKLMARA